MDKKNKSLKKQRYTMQDIANEVGVSKATVSYVLNNKPNARVGEETRSKILHVANLFNFSPNMTAKYLSSDHLHPVGIVLGGRRDIHLFAQDYMPLLAAVIDNLEAHSYHTLMFSDFRNGDDRNIQYPCEALIGINLSQEDVAALSGMIFVPLILVDTLTNDSLFYQLHFDYASIISLAEQSYGRYGFVCVFYPYQSVLFRRHLAGVLPAGALSFCEDIPALTTFVRDQSAQGRHILFFGPSLAYVAGSHLAPGQYTIVTCGAPSEFFSRGAELISCPAKAMAKTIVDLLEVLLTRRQELFPGNHIIQISI